MLYFHQTRLTAAFDPDREAESYSSCYIEIPSIVKLHDSWLLHENRIAP